MTMTPEPLFPSFGDGVPKKQSSATVNDADHQCPASADRPTADREPELITGGQATTAEFLRGAALAPISLDQIQIPGYQILSELGRGGMGVVYQARHLKLNRVVALKMILAGAHASPDQVMRFLSEAEALAAFQHPNLVQVFEVGQHRQLPFMALEFVAGGALSDWLRVEKRSPGQVARIVEQLAHGMNAAHQAGIVHRDLKPGNVLLTPDGTPKITDFGLAKRLESGAGLTQTGTVLGTPSYMAPEQAAGRGNRVGPAADVYALGAILYKCLTGSPPFDADNAIDTLLQVASEEPKPPSQLNPKIPRDLETICLKCLAKEPGRRYPSAEALAEDLRHWQAGEPITARPVSRAERFVKWTRRQPALAALITVSVLAAVSLISLGAYFIDELSTRTKRAEKGEFEAVEQQHKTAREADAAWANQYDAHMSRADSDWKTANLRRIQDTLDIYRTPPPGRKDVRGWEWHHQDRLCDQGLGVFKGHQFLIHCVAFSPDGSLIVSASGDRTLALWDAATGRRLRTFQGHSKPVWAVAFSPDGTRLASASEDGTVRFWDPALGRELRSPEGRHNGLYCLAYSPDGQQVVAAGIDGLVKVWNAADGRERVVMRGHDGPIRGVAFSPDGKRLASAGDNGNITFWDVVTGRDLRSRPGHPDRVNCVAFSPDGLWLASSGEDGSVVLRNALTGEAVRDLKGHTDAVRGLSFSPDGTRLATASRDRTIKVWDVAGGVELRTIKGHLSSVYSVAFSPDGMRLASGSGDWTVRLWGAGSGRELRILTGHSHSVWNLAFSPDGRRLASASHDRTVKLWNPLGGSELLTLTGHEDNVSAVEFSPDGTWLASASKDRTIKLWDLSGRREVQTLRGHDSGVQAIAHGPRGTFLVSGDLGGTMKVWDLAAGQAPRSWKAHEDRITAVACSPDGQTLASSSDDRTVKLWNAATLAQTHVLKGHPGFVLRVVFSPDGTKLASAGADWSVKIWETAGGREVQTLNGHTDWVLGLAFNPDGSRLVSGSLDRTVKVWDATTWQELRTLTGQTDLVYSVTFSPDGTRLASAGSNPTIRLWDARPLTPAVKAEAEALALLDECFGKPLSRDDVRTEIQNQRLLDEEARRYSLEHIGRFREETDPEKYHASAWPVIRHPHANVFMVRKALAQLKAACERVPDEDKFRVALAVAHYRLGKFQGEHYQRALEQLLKCNQQQPLTLAFLAMTQRQLGRDEEGQATFVRLRNLLKKEPKDSDPGIQAILAEAGIP